MFANQLARQRHVDVWSCCVCRKPVQLPIHLVLLKLCIVQFGFINTYATPIALENIKYKFVFIFVAWDIIEAVIWYLICVETVGRTLEELEEIFNQRNPVAASKKKYTIAIGETGDVALLDQA